jgi:mRNA-degrading endonuclease RelE of RelBE toxin-antitoxin system
MAGYVVHWTEEARAEIEELHPFHWPAIEKAVALLEHDAEVETRNRRPLQRERLPPDFPDPTWQQRAGAHRVLYAVEGRTVTVLRVILKGRRTTGESL